MIYHYRITTLSISLSEQAYQQIRRMIIRLELAPGDVVREDALQRQLGIGRTPIREALQRLARDQFVTVMPRRGMFVSRIDVSELSLLYETRACSSRTRRGSPARAGGPAHWDGDGGVLARAERPRRVAGELLDIDRRATRSSGRAAGNRFLTDTLDMLYAQSDRLWHMYLADVADMLPRRRRAPPILDALVDGDADRAAELAEAHVRSFDHQIRDAVTRRLGPPLAGT